MKLALAKPWEYCITWMLKFKISLYIYTVHQIICLEGDCLYSFTIISWKLKVSRCFLVLVVSMTTETLFTDALIWIVNLVKTVARRPILTSQIWRHIKNLVVLSSNDQFLLARRKNYEVSALKTIKFRIGKFGVWTTNYWSYGTNTNKSLIQQTGQPSVIGRLGDG